MLRASANASGPSKLGSLSAERGPQFGNGGDGRVAVVAEAAADRVGQSRIRAHGLDQLADDAAEHLKRPLAHLIASLAAKHPHSLLAPRDASSVSNRVLPPPDSLSTSTSVPQPALRPPDLLVQLLQARGRGPQKPARSAWDDGRASRPRTTVRACPRSARP